MYLARRARNLGESPTLALQARVVELIKSGRDIVSFALGEPDFETPLAARERAKEAIDQGHTHYTANQGIAPLIKAVRQHYETKFGLRYADDQVVVSSGSKFDLYAGMLAVLEPGDEVLVPTPVWVSTIPQIELAGGRAVPVPCHEVSGFLPSVRDLNEACSERTRMICLNSPHNPTGTVYPRATLEAIAELVVRRDLTVISDEIYQALVFDNTVHTSIASISPELAERTLVVWGVAKSYAMTGWRIGFAAGPREWIQAINRLQSQITSCASSIGQYAALQAILGCAPDTDRMRDEFNTRRLYMLTRLREMPGLTCTEPRGAFYVFPGIASYFGRRIEGRKIENSLDFCAALLELAGVAATPGSAFECEGHLRLSYSISQDGIETGLDRLAEFLARFDA